MEQESELVARVLTGLILAVLVILTVWNSQLLTGMNETIRTPRHEGSGQVVTSPWGNTERWIVNGELESLEAWGARVLEAKHEFEQEKYR